MIAELQIRLVELEAEIHRTFEIRNSSMDQITGINQFEPLFDELRDVLSETEQWMEKYIAVYQTEKVSLLDFPSVHSFIVVR